MQRLFTCCCRMFTAQPRNRAGGHGIIKVQPRPTRRELGVVTAPRRTRWLNPLTFRRDGFARVEYRTTGVDDHQNRELQTPGHTPHPGSSLAAWRLPAAVPLDSPRTAGARGAMVTGPLNRILKTACIHLGSVPGPVKPAVQNLEAHDAERIAAEIIARTDGTRPYYTSPSA